MDITMQKKLNKKYNLYLFCNDNYGYEYLKTMIEIYDRYYKKINLTVILSSKQFRVLPNDSIRKKIMKRIYFLKYLFFKESKCSKLLKKNKINFKFIKNINSKSFIEQIPYNSIGIIAGFNQIFRKDLISRFRILVNFHPSLLPSYRGPIPSYWVIKNKEKITGVTMHVVTEKIDEGEIIYNKSLMIKENDTEETLDYKLSKLGSEILREHFLDIITANLKKELEYDIHNLKASYYGFVNKSKVNL